MLVEQAQRGQNIVDYMRKGQPVSLRCPDRPKIGKANKSTSHVGSGLHTPVNNPHGGLRCTRGAAEDPLDILGWACKAWAVVNKETPAGGWGRRI